MPTLCRIEYLTPDGWKVGHAGMNLLHPEGYVARLEANNKFGRATELDGDLQPTGKVWEPKKLPRLEDLHYNGKGNPNVPALRPACSLCSSRKHDDGMCLL